MSGYGSDARFRMMELPFSPLVSARWYGEDDMDEFFIAPRDYGSRQAYLRSYTFTRAEPDAKAKAAEKVKQSLTRLRAAAWAVVACQYRLPLRARILKEKMIIRSSQYLNSGVYYLCAPMPRCLVAAA